MSWQLRTRRASEVGQGGEEAEGDGGVDVVRGRRQLASRDLEELPWDQCSGPVAHEDEEEDGRHKGHPGSVEGLAQVVLGDVRGEAKGHLLKVPHAAGGAELADRRLGLAGHSGHLRADADHGARREEPGRHQRGPGEGARGRRGRGHRWAAQARLRGGCRRSRLRRAAQLLCGLGAGAPRRHEGVGGVEGQAKPSRGGRTAQQRRAGAHHF